MIVTILLIVGGIFLIMDNDNHLVVSQSKKYLGVPYVWGGAEPNGMDCSGLTQLVYKDLGKTIPRQVTEQAENAPYQINVKGYSLEQLKQVLNIGDWIGLDYEEGGRYSHTGLYIGNNEVLHASSSAGKVVIVSLSSWWASNARKIYHY